MILLQCLMTNSSRHQVSMKVLYPEKHTHITAELQAGCSDVKAFVLKILLHGYCIHLKISTKVKWGFLVFCLFFSNKPTNLPKHLLSSRKMGKRSGLFQYMYAMVCRHVNHEAAVYKLNEWSCKLDIGNRLRFCLELTFNADGTVMSSV